MDVVIAVLLAILVCILVLILYWVLSKKSAKLNGGDWVRRMRLRTGQPIFTNDAYIDIDLTQRYIWNNYINVVNGYLNDLVPFNANNDTDPRPYIVGDVHGSYLQFFVPLIMARVVKDVCLKPVLINANQPIDPRDVVDYKYVAEYNGQKFRAIVQNGTTYIVVPAEWYRTNRNEKGESVLHQAWKHMDRYCIITYEKGPATFERETTNIIVKAVEYYGSQPRANGLSPLFTKYISCPLMYHPISEVLMKLDKDGNPFEVYITDSSGILRAMKGEDGGINKHDLFEYLKWLSTPQFDNHPVLYLGDIINNSIHGMDMGLISVLLNHMSGVYWCFGNHDVSLLLYAMDMMHNDSDKLNLNGDLIYNLGTDAIDYSDYYGFVEISKCLVRCLEQENNNYFRIYYNDNGICASHTVIPLVDTENTAIDKTTDDTENDINGHPEDAIVYDTAVDIPSTAWIYRTARTQDHIISLDIHNQYTNDYHSIYNMHNLYQVLDGIMPGTGNVSKNDYEPIKLFLPLLYRLFTRYRNEFVIPEDKTTIAQGLPYYVGHLDIRAVYNLYTVDEQLMNDHFAMMLKYSKFAALWPSDVGTLTQCRNIFARCALTNELLQHLPPIYTRPPEFPIDNIIYCDAGSGTAIANNWVHSGFELISFRAFRQGEDETVYYHTQNIVPAFGRIQVPILISEFDNDIFYDLLRSFNTMLNRIFGTNQVWFQNQHAPVSIQLLPAINDRREECCQIIYSELNNMFKLVHVQEIPTRLHH